MKKSVRWKLPVFLSLIFHLSIFFFFALGTAGGENQKDAFRYESVELVADESEKGKWVKEAEPAERKLTDWVEDASHLPVEKALSEAMANMPDMGDGEAQSNWTAAVKEWYDRLPESKKKKVRRLIRIREEKAARDASHSGGAVALPDEELVFQYERNLASYRERKARNLDISPWLSVAPDHLKHFLTNRENPPIAPYSEKKMARLREQFRKDKEKSDKIHQKAIAEGSALIRIMKTVDTEMFEGRRKW